MTVSVPPVSPQSIAPPHVSPGVASATQTPGVAGVVINISNPQAFAGGPPSAVAAAAPVAQATPTVAAPANDVWQLGITPDNVTDRIVVDPQSGDTFFRANDGRQVPTRDVLNNMFNDPQVNPDQDPEARKKREAYMAIGKAVQDKLNQLHSQGTTGQTTTQPATTQTPVPNPAQAPTGAPSTVTVPVANADGTVTPMNVPPPPGTTTTNPFSGSTAVASNGPTDAATAAAGAGQAGPQQQQAPQQTPTVDLVQKLTNATLVQQDPQNAPPNAAELIQEIPSVIQELSGRPDVGPNFPGLVQPFLSRETAGRGDEAVMDPAHKMAVDTKQAAMYGLTQHVLSNPAYQGVPTTQLPGFNEIHAAIMNPQEDMTIRKSAMACLSGFAQIRPGDPDITAAAEAAKKPMKRDVFLGSLRSKTKPDPELVSLADQTLAALQGQGMPQPDPNQMAQAQQPMQDMSQMQQGPANDMSLQQQQQMQQQPTAA